MKPDQESNLVPSDNQSDILPSKVLDFLSSQNKLLHIQPLV